MWISCNTRAWSDNIKQSVCAHLDATKWRCDMDQQLTLQIAVNEGPEFLQVLAKAVTICAQLHLRHMSHNIPHNAGSQSESCLFLFFNILSLRQAGTRFGRCQNNDMSICAKRMSLPCSALLVCGSALLQSPAELWLPPSPP